MERPYVLGVDLDGVCGDYTDAFRTVVAEELGCGLEDLPLERSWDFVSERRFDRMRAQMKPTSAYAAFMAAISGPTPMILMTRLRL